MGITLILGKFVLWSLLLLYVFFLVFLSESVPGMHTIVLPSLLLPDGGQQHSSILQHGSSQEFLSQSVRYGETFSLLISLLEMKKILISCK